jgi:tellurite resistance protein TehA-like permease
MLFIVLSALYGIKTVRNPSIAVAEFRDPSSASNFACITVAVVIVAAAILPHAPSAALFLWALGTGGQCVLFLTSWGDGLLTSVIARRHFLKTRHFVHNFRNPKWCGVPASIAMASIVIPNILSFGVDGVPHRRSGAACHNRAAGSIAKLEEQQNGSMREIKRRCRTSC